MAPCRREVDRIGYTTYDFSESLNQVSLDIATVDSVVAAWGDSSEGYCQWEGGFLIRLKDGRWAYLTGWCDTSGWGCQDGAEIVYYDTLPDRATLNRSDESWDEQPADLNRYIQGLITEHDTAV